MPSAFLAVVGVHSLNADRDWDLVVALARISAFALV